MSYNIFWRMIIGCKFVNTDSKAKKISYYDSLMNFVSRQIFESSQSGKNHFGASARQEENECAIDEKDHCIGSSHFEITLYSDLEKR